MVYGIDVSEHNGKLDWAKIKAAGIKFAIIRTGYGVSHEDEQFVSNITGALAQGIPVGAYHFSYALNESGAKKEAAFCMKLLEPYKDKITLPIFFDFEYDTVSYAAKQGVTLGKTAFNAHTVAFCEAVKAAGYTPGVYYNLDYKNSMVNDGMLGDYVQWYAQYANKSSWTGYDLWQYSSKHTINGLSGYFDINVASDSFLEGKSPVVAGWEKNDKGWWYLRADGSWPADGWEEIGGRMWRFDEGGYLMTNATLEEGGLIYTFDDCGYYTTVPVQAETSETAPEDKEEETVEAVRYNTLGEVKSETYRATLDKLVAKGIIQGKGGKGEELILDLGEDAIRLLVYLDRAGVF